MAKEIDLGPVKEPFLVDREVSIFHGSGIGGLIHSVKVLGKGYLTKLTLSIYYLYKRISTEGVRPAITSVVELYKTRYAE